MIEDGLKVIAIYSVFLTAFGSIGNLISVVVCSSKTLRKTPTFVFCAFMLVADTISLYFWNLDHYFMVYYGHEIEMLSLFLCRFMSILQTFSLQSSAWLLAAMTIERCLSAYIKLWRIKYFTSKTAVVTTIIICSCILIIVTGICLRINFVDDNNLPLNITCYYTDTYKVLTTEHYSMYSLIPFVIMIIGNLFLIHELVSKNKVNAMRQSQTQRKRKSISISIISLTTIFLLATLPNSIVGAFYLQALYESEKGLLILYSLDSLSFSFHSFSCIALFITNKQFRLEFKNLLSLTKKNKVKTTLFTTTRHNCEGNQH